VKPEALYVPGYYAEVALILKQFRQFGMMFPALGCDGWANQTLLSVAGKAAEGTYFTNHFSPEDPAPVVQRFVQAYRQKYGQIPDTFGALGYDAAMILTAAIGRVTGKFDSEAVRNALAQTREYPGVTGSISFDAQRNASKPALVITVKDGKFEIVERIAP
jgi:branched-chain amino acid transport system substrate-binding protein